MPYAIQHTLTPLLPALLRAPGLIEARAWWRLSRLLRRVAAALRHVLALLEQAQPPCISLRSPLDLALTSP